MGQRCANSRHNGDIKWEAITEFIEESLMEQINQKHRFERWRKQNK
jgi:hypothetical protein